MRKMTLNFGKPIQEKDEKWPVLKKLVHICHPYQTVFVGWAAPTVRSFGHHPMVGGAHPTSTGVISCYPSLNDTPPNPPPRWGFGLTAPHRLMGHPMPHTPPNERSPTSHFGAHPSRPQPAPHSCHPACCQQHCPSVPLLHRGRRCS